MATLSDLLLSCWTVEAARSATYERRGNQQAAVRSAARARILASRCAAEGIKIVPNYATQHAEFMYGIAGTEEEMGALGLIFLQRIGMYINAHTKDVLSAEEHSKLVELAEPELDEVNQALMDGRLMYPPPYEFPSAPFAQAPGKVVARFGILGDPHVGVADNSVQTALRQMGEAGADFIVAIGDLTKDGRIEDYARAKEILQTASVPVIGTLGNHDLFKRDPDEPSGVAKFRSTFGIEPNAVHEHNGVRVIVINSANPMLSPFKPFDLNEGEFTDGTPQSVPGGTFSQDTVAWMSTLEKAGPTFILLHQPPYPYLGMPPLVFGLDEPSTAILAELADRVKAQAVFCGHTHRFFRTEFEGVPMVECASSSDWPFAYSLIEVTDQGWSFNLYPIDYDAELDPTNHKDYLFRRYATGPEDARAFVEKF